MASNELLVAGISAVFGQTIRTEEQHEEFLLSPEGRGHVAKELSMEEIMKASYQYGAVGELENPNHYRLQTLMGDKAVVTVSDKWNTEDLKLVAEPILGFPAGEMKLYVGGKQLEDGKPLLSYNIPFESTINVTRRLPGGGCGTAFYLNGLTCDPEFHYDFTDKDDDGTVFHRGGERYHRPYGWHRTAIKVKGRYDDDVWLGQPGHRTDSSPGEWPVSYHGTSSNNALSIANYGYELSKGKRFKFGKGIYSTPLVAIAEDYAEKFQLGNVEAKIVFQNRCDPSQDVLQMIQGIIGHMHCGDYWITKDETQLRPYGILIKILSPGSGQAVRSVPNAPQRPIAQPQRSWCSLQ